MATVDPEDFEPDEVLGYGTIEMRDGVVVGGITMDGLTGDFDLVPARKAARELEADSKLIEFRSRIVRLKDWMRAASPGVRRAVAETHAEYESLMKEALADSDG